MAPSVKTVLGRDKHMRRLMKKIGAAPIGERPLFDALVRAIISQMMSVHAARAIGKRLEARVGLDPERLSRVRRTTLRNLGLSNAKSDCMRTVAKLVARGEFDDLPRLSDDEVYERLTEIKGIGRWTAQMVMIFSLGRPDIWPTGDLALAKAVQTVKALPRLPVVEDLTRIARAWAPYRAVAARILWHFYLSRTRVGISLAVAGDR